jgi:hypothetical protein
MSSGELLLQVLMSIMWFCDVRRHISTPPNISDKVDRVYARTSAALQNCLDWLLIWWIVV